jgi:hypothetical protein
VEGEFLQFNVQKVFLETLEDSFHMPYTFWSGEEKTRNIVQEGNKKVGEKILSL